VASVPLCDLNQVAAGVVEDRRGHGPHLRRLLREPNTERREPLELLADIVDGKRREGNSVADERRLERVPGRVLVGLEYQLGAVGVVRRDSGEPACWPSGTSVFFSNPRTSV
jgi:hypothetical protein